MMCDDCYFDIPIPEDIVEGEIISCPSCGLKYEFKNGKLVTHELEGEDWGE